jgi:ribosomal protein S18 acetylase RimI-like enzyme
MVGLFDIVVDPAARRRGAGKRITAALMAWGRSLGAAGAYVQVVASNVAAIGLYERLGFRVAYGYHYRIRP